MSNQKATPEQINQARKARLTNFAKKEEENKKKEEENKKKAELRTRLRNIQGGVVKISTSTKSQEQKTPSSRGGGAVVDSDTTILQSCNICYKTINGVLNESGFCNLCVAKTTDKTIICLACLQPAVVNANHFCEECYNKFN